MPKPDTTAPTAAPEAQTTPAQTAQAKRAKRIEREHIERLLTELNAGLVAGQEVATLANNAGALLIIETAQAGLDRFKSEYGLKFVKTLDEMIADANAELQRVIKDTPTDAAAIGKAANAVQRLKLRKGDAK